MIPPMRRSALILALVAFPVAGLSSCATEEEKRNNVGPTSNTPRIPWNTPGPGQGQGAFGMLPQNQHRR
jgi:hypothetical protein